MSHTCFERRERRTRLGFVLLAVVFLASSATLAGCSQKIGTEAPDVFDMEPTVVKPRLDIKWRTHLNPTPPWDYQPQEFATPAYANASDTLYVATTHGEAFRVRAGDGEVQWGTRLDGGVHGQPVLGVKRVYIGTLEGTLYALDRRSGEVAWTASTDGSIGSSAAVAHGRVFFTDSKNRITALDAQTGKNLWSYSRSSTESFTVEGTGTPVVHNDLVMVGFSDGILAAIQIDTGEPVWEADLAGDKEEFLDVDAPVVLENGRIYAASYEGGMYALDAETGDLEWYTDISSIAAFDHGDGMVYVASALGRIAILDAEDGKPLYAYSFKERDPVDLRVTDRYIIVSTGDGPMYFLDRMTGYPLLTWNPSSGFNTKMVIGRERTFAFSNRGYLYGVDVAF